MVPQEIEQVARAYSRALTERGVRVTHLILFGSYAKGIAHRDSDIDLAVVSPDFGRNRFEEGALLQKIARRVDPRLAPVPVSSRSYTNDLWIPLIYEIRQNGIELLAA